MTLVNHSPEAGSPGQFEDGADTPADPRVAGFAIRAVARLIDGTYGFAVGFLAVVIASIGLTLENSSGTPDEWARSMQGFRASAFLVSTLGALAYYAISEYIGGTTLGKLLCGLRVVSTDFTSVSLFGALVRSAVFLIDSLFFGVVAYAAMASSPLRQRLGDRWGGTIVVRRRYVPDDARCGPALIVLGLLAGTFVWAALSAWEIMRAVMQS